MAEALLSLVTDLLTQLGSFSAQQALQELQLLVGVDDEVQNFQYNLNMVQAMLNKFEERRLRDDAFVKPWYDKLEDAYYMMDNVSDTWKTAEIKLQIQKEEEREKAAHSNAPALPEKKMKKVRSFFLFLSRCFRQVDNFSVRHEVGHEIKKLNGTLADILRGRQEFGIDLNSQPERVERLEITSIVDVSEIVGRNEFKYALLNHLLGVGSQQERNPLVISLVGIGGIGKSTLAKLAYNHPTVIAHFDQIVWVSVSDPFTECNVAKAIIQKLDPKHESLKYTTPTLDLLLCIVSDLIKGKMFFLVFDDVWAKDIPKESKKWKPFKDVLTHGAQGSRILVTTRNEDVAHMMGSAETHIINLGKLSVDDCWLIIREIAFINGNIDQHKDLEPLGRELAIKCRGLPLAANLIGGHMRDKRSKEEWVKVSDSSLWDLEDVEKGLLGPLLLSYYELSPAEKQCFLFCAVFPKDHVTKRFMLVTHWMAEGYINLKGNREMEDIAEECFKKLAMRSFFQDFEKDENNGRIKSCKMHDIVHDFAQLLTKDVCFTIECEEEVKKDFKRARWLSVKETFSEFVYKTKNLRFLKLDFISSQIVQPKLFDNLPYLRILHLEGQSILKLLNQVEKLIHLRYLKLSCSKIKELPESICNLCNLQSLDVSKCLYLEKLPKGIGKLINLRHLLLNGIIVGIKSFPKGIGRLTCLKTLGYFPVGGKGKEICELGELEHLNHIQGELTLFGLNNVEDSDEVKNALKMKSHLRDLCLLFKTLDEMNKEEEEEEVETEEERRRKMEKDVAILNALEPPPSLESLEIVYYKGTTMYRNLMMSEWTYLGRLLISQCPNLGQLPPLGKLPLLEELKIVDAPMIQKVGDEFLGIDNNNKGIIIFPNLKSLKFEDLEEWKEWSGMGGTIEEEEEKDNSANAFVTINTPKIQIMPRLHSLTIRHCYHLKSLPDYLRNTPLLQELDIYSYEGTTMYPNWMMSKLTSLKSLYIGECPNLEQLPPLGKLPLLEELEIKIAPMIQKVGDEFLGIDIEEEELSESSKDIIIFPNLKSLTFEALEKWEEWSGMGGTIEEEEEEEKDNSANAFVTNNTPKIKIMPLLHSLLIVECDNLKSLPDYLRNTPLLKELEITFCPILEQRCDRGIGDYWPNISHIPNIKIDFKYVQKDGQLPESIDSEIDEEAPEAGR